MHKLGQGEHHFSELLIVNVGIHCSDDKEKQKSNLVRRVKAVDNKVANPGNNALDGIQKSLLPSQSNRGDLCNPVRNLKTRILTRYLITGQVFHSHLLFAFLPTGFQDVKVVRIRVKVVHSVQLLEALREDVHLLDQI